MYTDVPTPWAPYRGPVSPSTDRSVGSTTRQMWSRFFAPAPSPRSPPPPARWRMKSMIVGASTRTDGNGAWPARHSSTRTPSRPSSSQYHASDRSTSATANTRWSNPLTFTFATAAMVGMPVMIDRADLDHVAVATEDQQPAWLRYAGELGGQYDGGGPSPGFWAGQVAYANGMRVEVLEPANVDQNDFLRRFLDRNGPGP